MRQPRVRRLDTGEMLAKTSPDQVVVSGVLAGGAVASVHCRAGAPRGPGLLWEIHGSEGDLLVSGANGHAQIVPLALSGGRGADRSVAPMDVPARYRTAPAELDGPAVNVAQVYVRLAEDLRTGWLTRPDFDHAVMRHRMIAAIEEAARTGRRVSL